MYREHGAFSNKLPSQFECFALLHRTTLLLNISLLQQLQTNCAPILIFSKNLAVAFSMVEVRQLLLC